MRSEIVVGGENGKEASEPSVLMMHHQNSIQGNHHLPEPCSRSVIIQSTSTQPTEQPSVFAPPLPISERREFREPELDIGSFF